MARFLLAIMVLFALLAGWLVVQRLARGVAARHPRLGRAREEGEGCGGCGPRSGCGHADKCDNGL